MEFNVFGPFTVPRHGSKGLITDQSLKDLKNEVGEKCDGLADACGCYLFALRAGKGFTPYYVGQAQRSSILKEALNPSNRGKYNKIISEKNGTPMLFFIPLITPTGKFRKKSPQKGQLDAINFLEGWLITEAIKKNPALVNNKRTKFLRNVHVIGYLNAAHGESHKSSRELTKALR